MSCQNCKDLRRIRGLLIRSLAKATGESRMRVRERPYGIACQHADLVEQLTRRLQAAAEPRTRIARLIGLHDTATDEQILAELARYSDEWLACFRRKHERVLELRQAMRLLLGTPSS